MKKVRLSILVLFICTLCFMLKNQVIAADLSDKDNNYDTYGKTITSNLIENSDGTLSRIEYMTSYILVENYDSNFRLIDSEKVECELSKYCGFYSGKDFNFIVYGQDNPDESDDVEVYRIVKYDKEWNRINCVSLKGNNTKSPGDTLRCCDYNGILYIRTCHTMYKSSDGLNHQANVTISVNIDSMTIQDKLTGIHNIHVGYVSHSFNQFITVDEGKLVAADHGDAYPRSVVLVKYDSSLAEGEFNGNCADVDVLKIKGEIGNNYTGVSVGGLEVSDTSYLVAGNSVVQDDQFESYKTRNIYVTVTSKNDFTESATQVKWITLYPEGSSSTTTPHLVKINSNRFLLLWERDTVINYVFLDGTGNATGSIATMNGSLSDCQPITHDGKVIWYTSWSGSMIFYMIDAQTGSSVIKPYKKEPQTIQVDKDSYNVSYGDNDFSIVAKSASGSALSYSSSDERVATVSSEGVVHIVGGGTAQITVNSAATDIYDSASMKISVAVSTRKQNVTVKKNQYNVVFGQADFSVAAVTNGNGLLSYRSSKSSVVTVSNDGKVKIIGAGKAIISISAASTDQYKASSVTKISIVVRKAKQKISVPSAIKKVLGDSDFAINANTSGDSILKYRSSNSKVVRVLSNGKLSIAGKGTAKITITAPSTKNYKTARKTIKIMIKTKKTVVKSKKKSVTVKIKKVKHTHKKIFIKWNKMKKASSYIIYRSTSKNGNYKKIGTKKSMKHPSYVDSSISSRKNYYYKVKAYIVER